MEYSKQHHVPTHILNNFKNEKGEFFYYNKERAHKGIELRNTEKVFYRRHQYSLDKGDGSKEVSIESKHFLWLDNAVKLVIDKILEAVRLNYNPELSFVERQLWDYYFVTQYFRSPEVLHSDNTIKMSEENYYELLPEIREEVRQSWPDSEHLLNDEAFVKRMISNAPKSSLLSDRERPLKALKSRGLYFGHVANSKKSLVIGSFPVMRYNSNGSNHLADERTQMWMPISADVMVSPGKQSGGEDILDVTDSFVRKQNSYILMQSNEIGGRSAKLLKSLLNPR